MDTAIGREMSRKSASYLCDDVSAARGGRRRGREGEDWWRFSVGELNFQGGIHHHDFRLLSALCEIDCDADYNALYAAIAERNGELGAGPARFVEEDNYLHVRGLIPLDAVDRAALIDAVAEVARGAAASSLRSTYRQW